MTDHSAPSLVGHAGAAADVAAIRGLAGFLKDEHARYVVDDVVFPGLDVTIAFEKAWATDPDGRPLDPEPAMVALYVLVKQDHRWLIAARANTPVRA